MSYKVVKFGGSSLADANQFRKVAAIIKSDDKRRFVVPSAPGKRFSDDIKVTDMLYKCCELAGSGVDFTEQLALIKERYNGIISDLGMDFSLEDEFDTIAKELKARPAKDYAASRGEYLNGKVLANYLGFNFVDAADVIIFDTKGILLLDETVKAVRERIKGLDNAVIPGFYGRTTEGYIKTFSRGGSDVTGSIIANAVRAEIYENWTDVSGFLVADPRIVEKPDVIETITYRELRELAYMGASVLHEDAIFPVRSAGIPINIRNTNAPEDPGTMIVSNDYDFSKESLAHTITGIAGRKGFSTINIEKAMMNNEKGFCMKVLKVLYDNDLSFEHMPSGIDTMSITLDSAQLEPIRDKVVAEIRKAVEPDHIEIEDGIATIAVVGRRMKNTRGTVARIFAAMAHARINVKLIDQGSSELNVIIGVSESDFAEAIRRIYDMFINSEKE
ncbi:aspartate kinase [Ruminococcus sp. XPD3002]|uniref:aspartate kinase n=1 Tax=Ruminococcus sp. XPD3002 TaxID=1452269 RepID=UPI00091F8242|nr:aspartate kinase [Ruminococcus sp.]MBR6986371.1 aspartate kinase [Ruminococcus sp.]SFX74432.1 aspartate kinase [Ruminococcus flavefaciens]HPY84295.1 aspartate kinase [Ruminococcus flavefaciens]HRU97090.1 aspartate kinase [Ruminococcus sp.]